MGTDNKKKIYILIGDEKYKINEIIKKLKNTFSLEKDDINFNEFFEKNSSIENIKTMINTLPFLAEKRLVVLHNTNFIYRIGNLNQFLTNIPATTALVIIEDSFNVEKKEYKILNELSTVISCSKATDDERKKVLEYILHQQKKTMDAKAKRYILENSEDELYSIINNTLKVCSATNESHINFEKVRVHISQLVKSRVFETVSAIIQKDVEKSMLLYKDLILLKEEEFMILSLLMREFRLHIQVKNLSKISDSEISKKLSIRDFVVRRIRKNLTNVSKEFLITGLNKLINLEIKIKAGEIDKKLGFQKVMLEIMTLKI